MLAFLNLGAFEVVLILVVSILVFGRRLPEVAGQAAGMVQRMRRSLADLRRETGIDREIQAARRAIEEAVPRGTRTIDMRRAVRRELDEVEREARAPLPPPSGAPAAPGPSAPSAPAPPLERPPEIPPEEAPAAGEGEGKGAQ